MVLLVLGDFLYEGILCLQVVVATQPEAGWVWILSDWIWTETDTCPVMYIMLNQSYPLSMETCWQCIEYACMRCWKHLGVGPISWF